MIQPPDHHLAEFNLGVLRHDWDDPRIADFANGIAPVMALAERSDGFVWRMSDSDMEAAQLDPDGVLGGNPRVASTLSVWASVADLEHFVWNTVHAQFYARRKEWYDLAKQGPRLAMWWVPVGKIPTIEDAVARMKHLETHGDSDHAFGWNHLKDAKLWAVKNCGEAEEAHL